MEGNMDEKTCPALVDGKECGLPLLMVERELETEIEIYECTRGHRTEFLLGEIVKRRCQALVNDKPCGLPLTLIERDFETATEIYECPLDHRTYVPLEPDVVEDT
jgi:hypothetical protein